MSEETPIEQNPIEQQLAKLQDQNISLNRGFKRQNMKIDNLIKEQNTQANSIKSVQSDMLNNASTIDNLKNILNVLKQTSDEHESKLKNLIDHVQTEIKSMQQNIQGVKETHNAHKEEFSSQLQNHKEELEEVQTKTEKTGEAVKVVAGTVQTTQEEKPQVTETVEGEADADAHLRLNKVQKEKLEVYNEYSGLNPITEDDIINLIKRNKETIINVKLSKQGNENDSGYKIGHNGSNPNAEVMFTKAGWFKDTDNINVVPVEFTKNDNMGLLTLNFKNDEGTAGITTNLINNVTNTGSGLMDNILRTAGFRTGGKKTRRKNKKQKRKSIKKRRKSRK